MDVHNQRCRRDGTQPRNEGGSPNEIRPPPCGKGGPGTGEPLEPLRDDASFQQKRVPFSGGAPSTNNVSDQVRTVCVTQEFRQADLNQFGQWVIVCERYDRNSH